VGAPVKIGGAHSLPSPAFPSFPLFPISLLSPFPLPFPLPPSLSPPHSPSFSGGPAPSPNTARESGGAVRENGDFLHLRPNSWETVEDRWVTNLSSTVSQLFEPQVRKIAVFAVKLEVPAQVYILAIFTTFLFPLGTPQGQSR